MSTQKTRPQKILSDNISGITKPALQRLLYRSDVARTDTGVYEELRGIIKENLTTILDKALTFTDHEKRKTISENDIRGVAQDMGRTLIATTNVKSVHGKVSKVKSKSKTEAEGEPQKKRKMKTGKAAEKYIKKYKAMNDCLLIPILPFERYCREVVQGLSDKEYRFQKDALTILQLWIESYIVSLCTAAKMICDHSARQTLMSKDIRLVRAIRNEN